MIKDFDSIVILTSQNPGAFINFRYEALESSTYIIPVVLDNSTYLNDDIYVNGFNMSNVPVGVSLDYAIALTPTKNIASFYINTHKFDDFSKNLKFYVYNYNDYNFTTILNEIDVSILNRPFLTENKIWNYNNAKMHIDDESSFMIMRTNPKFTGNIKLMVDSSNCLYLDTFKITNELNNKKYRHQKVSAESNLSSDIAKVFSNIPDGQLYKFNDQNLLNISVPYTNLNNQFNTQYSYGARLLVDELYEEKFSILAPLWINSQLPDYFAIFRVDETFNTESYLANDLSLLPTKFISNGKLIKSWSLKELSPLGTYLSKHLAELNSQNVRAPLFLPLSNVNQNDSDYNTWNGISWKKGITVGLNEHPYNFNKISNYTKLNEFLSSGFERLNLLAPNIINLEYAFNDTDASLYKMYRYYGLYLSDNELYKISYYAENPDSSVNIISLDQKDSSIFLQNSNIFDSSTGNINNTFSNRIFSLTDIDGVYRITNKDEILYKDASIINKWINKPGKSLFSASIKNLKLNPFITFSIENVLNQGEHLRIVNKTTNIIWELYSTNSDIYKAEEIGEYVSTTNNLPTYPIVYRTCFSSKGTTNNQITAIKKGFELFSNFMDIPFYVSNFNFDKSQLSIQIKNDFINEEWEFQRISSNTRNNPIDEYSSFNTSGAVNDIKFFGVYTPIISDFEILNNTHIRGPYDFELYGDRLSLSIKFINNSIDYSYSFLNIYKDLFTPNTMYMGKDKWYRLIKPINISISYANNLYNFNNIKDPTNDDNYIIYTGYELYDYNGVWNAYDIFPVSISLMGINPVKDMDYTVYDSSLGFKSDYWYKREDDISTYSKNINKGESYMINNRNVYRITKGNISWTKYYLDSSIVVSDEWDVNSQGIFTLNTFHANYNITANTDTILTYPILDGSTVFKSFDVSISEESIYDYYKDPSTKGFLNYPLVTPYISKWVGLGNDCRNNEYKLLLDSKIIKDSSTCFIPYNNYYSKELSYPSFKYLSGGDRAWENYIFYDVNDVITYYDNNIKINTSFRNLMIDQPYLDVFSKLIYSNDNIDKVKNRSSICYYNDFKKSIDSLILGLNLSLVVNNTASNLLNVKSWNKFKISFISSPSINNYNNYPIECIINENTKTILIIWYQGADILNYNKRNSSYFDGKNLLYDDPLVSGVLCRKIFKNNNNYWGYSKTPYIVSFNSPTTFIQNMYDISSGYSISMSSPFMQINENNIINNSTIFNAFGNNSVSNYTFNFDTTKNYHTFNNYIDYVYDKNLYTFGDGVINTAFTYMNNSNLYTNTTCDLNVFKNILLINNINYIIIRNNQIYNNTNFTSIPINIKLNDPKIYKNIYVHNGWFKPKFNNILNFSVNENKDIINNVELDFILGNTNLINANNIKQYWYNKVVNIVSSTDVSTKNAIGFKTDYNVFSSQWDKNYYNMVIDGSSLFIDGYNASLEQPSFFGSKLINLPTNLKLENWYTSNIKSYISDNFIKLEFNLTNQIIDQFKYNGDFIKNWDGLEIETINIQNYIKDTVLNYYNISIDKIKVNIWSKSYDGTRLYLSKNNEFSKDQNLNFNGTLNVINNEYIYKMDCNKLPDLSYYISFDMFEK